MDDTATISELWCYPVKSMTGGRVQTCTADARGVLGDRGYAVIDRSNGKVASAKHPRKWGSLLLAEACYVDEPVRGASLPPVNVTFPDGSSVRSDGPAADATLSRFTGRDVALTSAKPEGPTFEEVWPDVAGLAPSEFIDRTASGRTDEGQTVSSIGLASMAPGTFLDLAPLHLLTAATLAELARLVPDADFDRRRYRPNVVLEARGEGFVENSWVGRSLRAGECVMPVVLPTMRCVMTTLAQKELPMDRATLAGIARHNRIEIEGLGTWACAGVYAGVDGIVTLSVGDTIEIPA